MSTKTQAARGFHAAHRGDGFLFLTYIGLIWLGMLLGFGAEIARRDRPYPLIVHVHSLVFVGWLLAFTAQIVLIRIARPELHRRLGIVMAFGVALLAVIGPRQTRPATSSLDGRRALELRSAGRSGRPVCHAGLVAGRKMDIGDVMRTLLHAVLISAIGCTSASAQQVAVSGGKVLGMPMADGSSMFYGIPYAAAPAGDLRWKPPAARAPWSGVLDATKVAPACPQGDTGWNKNFLGTMQEDCLTVSIRTPPPEKNRLPVLVYIHGGSNAYAGAGDMAEDALHREGIVVVKLQYRLGAWGFLGLDALRGEDPHRSSGNYALLDQLAALKWIQANIANFGGDAGNVTISGNSAGAMDALLLTLSPLSKGLFHKAILQTAAPGAPRTAQQNEAIGNTLLDRLKLPRGAAGLAQLRKLPTATIDAAVANLPTPEGVDPSFIWEQQIIDGHVLKLPYAEAYAGGAGRDIRVIIGSNSQELGADRKPETVPALLVAAFGKQASKASALYRDDPVLGSVPTQLMTDMWFRCPASWLSQRMADTTRVWRYEFGLGAPGSGKPPEHTSEMEYVYRATPAKALPAEWPPVQRYWANFIRNGDPNGAGLPHWPTVGQGALALERAAYLDITPAGIVAREGLRAAQCKLMYEERDLPQSAAVPN